MMIYYKCGKCGAVLDTTDADPLHTEIERLRAALAACVKELTAWNSYEPCLLEAREALKQTTR